MDEVVNYTSPIASDPENDPIDIRINGLDSLVFSKTNIFENHFTIVFQKQFIGASDIGEHPFTVELMDQGSMRRVEYKHTLFIDSELSYVEENTKESGEGDGVDEDGGDEETETTELTEEEAKEEETKEILKAFGGGFSGVVISEADQKKLEEDEITYPKVTTGSLTPDGKMKLKFSQEMFFPQTIDQRLYQKLFEVYAISSVDQSVFKSEFGATRLSSRRLQSNEVSVEEVAAEKLAFEIQVESHTATEINLKLDFSMPDEVSSTRDG